LANLQKLQQNNAGGVQRAKKKKKKFFVKKLNTTGEAKIPFSVS
jgi:hypothetical protein